MNYGYDSGSPNWHMGRVEELANALTKLCKSYKDKNGMQPYVEVDGLYPGVRIRRMTHLTDEQQDELVMKADKLYDKIMKGGIDEEICKTKGYH